METINTIKGEITILNDKSIVISDSNSFLDMIASITTGTFAIVKENFPESFYDLKTGIAGEILQKVSNYNLRLIIIGNFDHIESKSLKDFIYECNKNGKIIFADDLDKAVSLLK